MEYFLYILQSEKNGSNYIGQTQDIHRRLKEHNNGEVHNTKPYCPWKLIYHKKYTSRNEAVNREREIKSHKKRKFIEKLIRSRNVAQPG